MYYDPTTPITTETEWLMSHAVDAFDGNNDHGNAVVEALHQLDDDDRELLEALFFERRSYRELGRRYGLSHVHVWRRAQAALDRLRQTLTDNPTIKERYDL